jgi:hypothetical protein
LSSTADIYKTICDHQKQYTGLPNIKYFTPLELKKMKRSLSLSEDSMEDAIEIMVEAREDCGKIWKAARELVSEAELPAKSGKDADINDLFKIDTFRRRYIIRKELIMQMEDVSWEDMKLFLIKEKGVQAEIKIWTNQVQATGMKDIIRKLCNAELKMEHHRAERLLPLLQASDQWKDFLDQRETCSTKRGESSKSAQEQSFDLPRPETDGSLGKEIV